MLFFRSEEHLQRWLHAEGFVRGAVLSLQHTWQLSRAWYDDRRLPAWRARTTSESQGILDRVGLTDPFWTLE